MNNTNFASKKLKGRGFSSAPLMNNYNKSINTKEVQNGRSMIEMLGVLAVIGVLSVGGIAGYSKAMMKYRVNKTIEQITLIAGNLRTFFGNQPPAMRYLGLGEEGSLNIMKKAKLVPDEIWADLTIYGSGGLVEGTYSFTNAFGGPVIIGDKNKFGSHGPDASQFAIIVFDFIPQQACIDIASQDWSDLNPEAVCINKVSSSITECTGFITDVDDAINKCNKEYNSIALIIK